MPWPAGLPALSVTDDYSETLPEGYFQTEADSGPGKRRPRPDRPNRPLTLNQLITADQKKILEDFYEQDLSYGALTFKDFHPVTGVLVTLWFKGEIHIPHAGGNLFRAIFQLEVLP